MGSEQARARRGLVAAVVLGLALRTWFYVLTPSVWHDEAALIVNALAREFAELLGPLYLAEAAPPLFLAVTRAVALVLGDSVPALRLVPFAASCAGLLLVAATAWRVLGARGAAWATLLLACSDRLLWHGCEAKPYAVEVLAAAGLAFLHVREMGLVRRLLLLAGLAPLVIFLCFPGCFLFGGVLVALLPAVWRASGVSRLVFCGSSIAPLTPPCPGQTPNTNHQPPTTRLGPWLAYGLLTVVVFAAFAWLALGPVRAQRCGPMEACWQHQFADWRRPWYVPLWALASTVDVVDYCCRLAGPLLAGLAVLGGVQMWRAGRRSLVVLLVLPVGLALLAACLGKYPYGGARVMAYAAPGVVLLVGGGACAALDWLRPRLRPAAIGLAGVLLLVAPLALYRAARPWQRADCDIAAAHVLQRFRPGDAVVSNHWEALYYFRRLGPDAGMPDGPDGQWASLVPLPGTARYRLDRHPPLEAPARLWVVCAGRSRRKTGMPWLAAWPAADGSSSSVTSAR